MFRAIGQGARYITRSLFPMEYASASLGRQVRRTQRAVKASPTKSAEAWANLPNGPGKTVNGLTSFLGDHPLMTGLGLGGLMAVGGSHPIESASQTAQELLWGTSEIDNYVMGEDISVFPFVPKVGLPFMSQQTSDALRHLNSTTIGDAWALKDQLNLGIGGGDYTQGVDEWTWRQAKRNVEQGRTDQINMSGDWEGYGGWSNSTQPYVSRAINNASGDIVLGMHNRRMA